MCKRAKLTIQKLIFGFEILAAKSGHVLVNAVQGLPGVVRTQVALPLNHELDKVVFSSLGGLLGDAVLHDFFNHKYIWLKRHNPIIKINYLMSKAKVVSNVETRKLYLYSQDNFSSVDAVAVNIFV